MSRARRTRNERRRDFIETICFMFALLFIGCVLSLMLCLSICKTWATHPAEQPITYAEYMASLGGEAE